MIRHGRLEGVLLLIVCISCIYPSILIAKVISNPIGINLAHIKYWSTELVFNDIFKRASVWGSLDKNTKLKNNESISVDKDGWVKKLEPNQWVRATMFADFRGHFPYQKYRCTYQGKGEIYFHEMVVLKRGDGWVDILPRSSNINYFSLTIKKTDPSNYIRNIRIIPLDAHNQQITQTFRQSFLKRWKPFRVIRFMDWMETNNGNVFLWSDRSTKTYFSQATRKGVALEYMVELANVLHVSPWFCMPHAANDEYIRNFALMVKKRLDPTLKIYIEYSNEVWNASFPAHEYAKKKGLILRLSSDSRLLWARYYTHRSLQVFKIWENVFGSKERLVRVLASQAVSLWWGKQVLDWENAYTKADAFAIAPYFEPRSLRGLPNTSQVPSITKIFSLLDQDIEKKITLFAKYQQMTRVRKLALIAYEGGQHLVARNNPHLDEKYDLVNRDPRMYGLYRKYLTAWFKAGGGFFLHYYSIGKYSRYGKWGLLEWYDQIIDPFSKFSAVIDSMNSNATGKSEDLRMKQRRK